MSENPRLFLRGKNIEIEEMQQVIEGHLVLRTPCLGPLDTFELADSYVIPSKQELYGVNIISCWICLCRQRQIMYSFLSVAVKNIEYEWWRSFWSARRISQPFWDFDPVTVYTL